MKRGFLLRAVEKKAAAKRRTGGAPQTEPLPSASEPPAVPLNSSLEGFDVADTPGYFNFGKAPHGNLTEEEKALPDYDLKKSRLVFKELDPNVTDFSGNTTAVTTIPHPVPDGENQCQWIVNGSTKSKVLSAPGYPARIPIPCRPNLYQVKSTPEMGIGLFAKGNIKRGDLFLAERPLLVSPRGIRAASDLDHSRYTTQQIRQIIMLEFESLLEFAISRLPSESQADYRALHNAHTADGSGPLLGIMRSNAYGTGLYDGSDKTSVVAQYGAVCKIGSRINHSCVPNVRYYFKTNSFSVQFYALQDIKPGEQLFYSYCSVESTRAQRQAELASYGFICECPACANATPESDKLRTTFGSKVDLISKMALGKASPISEAGLEDAKKLEKDMVREGLDTTSEFAILAGVIGLAYQRMGKGKEGDRYYDLLESYQKSMKRDE